MGVCRQAVSLPRARVHCVSLAQPPTIKTRGGLRECARRDVTIMWLVSERRGRADGDGDTEEQRERWLAARAPCTNTVDFKTACAGAGEPPAPPLAALPDPQQFNIFPAFFSRQLNFTGGGGCGQGSKIMEELRPNLVGGLLGVGGLLEEHQSDSKFLGGGVGSESKYTPDKARKCSNASSSSAEEFGALYSGEHAATPPAPPLSRSLHDHSGKTLINGLYTIQSTVHDSTYTMRELRELACLTHFTLCYVECYL